jgi:hypothetical protein
LSGPRQNLGIPYHSSMRSGSVSDRLQRVSIFRSISPICKVCCTPGTVVDCFLAR